MLRLAGQAPSRFRPLSSNVRAHQLLQRIRTTVQTAGAVALEGAAFLGSVGGAALAVAFGKALLAVALGAFAFGAFLRLSSRRRSTLPLEEQTPLWVAPVAAIATVVECAALVEAVDLPVRMSQPGFQYHHWLFVLAFVLVAYAAQSRLLRWLTARSRPKNAP